MACEIPMAYKDIDLPDNLSGVRTAIDRAVEVVIHAQAGLVCVKGSWIRRPLSPTTN